MPKKKERMLIAPEEANYQINSPESVSVESLISLAINRKVSVETIERLLAMRRELKAEFAKKSYDEAMAAFQADCPTIVKTKEVKTNSGKVAYRYAPIESIVQQVSLLLQRHGFSYSTSMELLENGVRVVVKTTHTDGHSEESPMEVPLGKKTDIMSDSQVVAAAQTFAKRYAFCNAFGILTGDEDTDARPEPKVAVIKVIGAKSKIAHLCKLLNIPLDPFTDDEVTKITKLPFIEENFSEIIKRLEFVVKERRENI